MNISTDIQATIDAFTSHNNDPDWPLIEWLEQPDQPLTLVLTIHDGITWLKGHFPDKPVLPGVVQVHWAALLGQAIFAEGQAFEKMANIKFQSMILPAMTVHLVLTFNGEKQQLSFQYQHEDVVLSTGKVQFHG